MENLIARPAKKAKYSNIKVEIDGIKFDSKKEAAYYGKLKMLKASGVVIDFQLQPKYDLIVNGMKLGFYKADFKVFWSSGIVRIVDVKGMKTPVYNLKKKMVKAIYDIDILEV
jgi:hypothetical protein